MEKLDIRISPVPMSVMDCLINKEVNDHFTASVKGYVTGEDSEILKCLYHKEFTIMAGHGDEADEVVFRGLVNRASISVEGKQKILSVEAASYTVSLDLTPQTRTFQETKKTFRKVAEYISAQTPGTSVIYAQEANQTVSGLMVQYDETDWGFLKRLAGKMGSLLVADCKNSFPSIYFGLPYKKHFTLDDVTDYQIKYYESAHGLAEYWMESGIMLELCSYVEFDHRLMRV